MSSPDIKRREIIIPESEKRIPEGYRLLMAGPGSIVALGFIGPDTRKGMLVHEGAALSVRTMSAQIDEQNLETVMSEYSSIYFLLAHLIGKQNITVLKNPMTMVKDSNGHMKVKEVYLPKELDFDSQDAPFLNRYYRTWPRDAHSLIGGRILANKNAWTVRDERIVESLLGEGGKVISRKNAILVTPDIWKNGKDEILRLRDAGFLIGCLPFVKQERQPYEFNEDHIDGHAILIEGSEGSLYLVVADSYSRQGGGTRKQIRQAANTIGAELVEVDDSGLPPLAFNLLQFDDGVVAMTASERQDLQMTLSLIVGDDKIYTTEIPIELIPNTIYGGIRCLTNLVPADIVQSALKSRLSRLWHR